MLLQIQKDRLFNTKRQAFYQNFLAVWVLADSVPGDEHEQPEAMDCAVEGLAEQTGDLSLHLAGGGAGLRIDDG
jgi:hypothetical protein